MYILSTIKHPTFYRVCHERKRKERHAHFVGVNISTCDSNGGVHQYSVHREIYAKKKEENGKRKGGEGGREMWHK